MPQDYGGLGVPANQENPERKRRCSIARRWVENRASRRFTGGRLSLGGPVVLNRFEDSLVVCTRIDTLRLTWSTQLKI
jgi:hypothetical protein